MHGRCWLHTRHVLGIYCTETLKFCIHPQFTCILVGVKSVPCIIHMQVSPGSQVLLDNVERYGLYLARSLNDTNSAQVLSRQNIGTLCHHMYHMKVVKVDGLVLFSRKFWSHSLLYFFYKEVGHKYEAVFSRCNTNSELRCCPVTAVYWSTTNLLINNSLIYELGIFPWCTILGFLTTKVWLELPGNHDWWGKATYLEDNTLYFPDLLLSVWNSLVLPTWMCPH